MCTRSCLGGGGGAAAASATGMAALSAAVAGAAGGRGGGAPSELAAEAVSLLASEAPSAGCARAGAPIPQIQAATTTTDERRGTFLAELRTRTMIDSLLGSLVFRWPARHGTAASPRITLPLPCR